jgi:hypothetical protein
MAVSRIAHGLVILVSISFVGCAATVDRASSPPPATASATVAAPSPTPGVTLGSPSPLPTSIVSSSEGSWLPAGELGEARWLTHVVRVGAGMVLVVGSDNVCMPATGGSDSVELGDPRTGTWKSAASLRTPRERPAVVGLPDGRALVAGGSTGEEGGPASYSSAYVFDPGTAAWSKSGLMTSARSSPSAAVLSDGRVLLAGGYYADPAHGNVPAPTLDSSEIWDPVTGVWTATGRLAQARFGASAVTLTDGRVLVVGGSASLEGAPIEVNSTEIFDPASGRWLDAGHLTEPRVGATLVALADGGALLVGGLLAFDAGDFGVSLVPTPTAERFDPRSGAWSRTSESPTAAAGQTVVTLADGRVLVAGGDITVNEPDLDVTPAGLTAAASIYDPATGIWQATEPMPRPRSGSSAVLLDDGSVLLAGGVMALRPDDTPSCPVADPQALRFVPGS